MNPTRLFAALLAATLALAACGSPDRSLADAGTTPEPSPDAGGADDAGTDAGSPPPTDGGPQLHLVTVDANGGISPGELHVRDGDTVEWRFASPLDAVVPAAAAAPSGTCPAPRAFGEPDDFTGPLPFAPSGVFSLGSLDQGLVPHAGSTCARGNPVAQSGGEVLCEDGAPQATMSSTWADPAVSGVFIRLEWAQVQPRAGTTAASFDFAALDRELNQAVRSGKLFSLGIKAGSSGTPDWIFSTNADGSARAGGGGGVQRLRLQDGGSGDVTSCGPVMDLGSPTDPAYQQRYFELLTAVARHLKSRADWYRALAYVKPSGANLFSHENRLPKRCSTGCICNPRVFAQAGYRPSKVSAFFRAQLALLAAELPGKPMAYALIQDGFPRIAESGAYEQEDGTSSVAGEALPRGTEQTEAILLASKTEQGPLFVVQHNGLGPKPPAGSCPNEGQHPAMGPFATAGSGCPNRWVLQAGSDGMTVTGFQTTNGQGVSSPQDVEAALDNEEVNSDGVFLELYEQRLWELSKLGGVLPSGRLLATRAQTLHQRRRAAFPQLADPLPAVVRYVFHGAAGQRFEYFDPRGCATARVIIDP